MSTSLTREELETSKHPDRLREMIPIYIRAGILRRIGMPDGGIQFIESLTDRVFVTFDRRGRSIL